MANVYLSKVESRGRNMFSETVPVSSTSDVVYVGGFENIAVQVVIGSCTSATVEYTMDDIDAIEGATADWLEWSEGTVQVDKGASIVRCVGLRLVNGDASNTVEWKVVG